MNIEEMRSVDSCSEGEIASAMVFDAGPSARPVPNLGRLEAFDAYLAWLRGTSE